MAVRQDELYAFNALYDKQLARRGGSSPALNKMRRLDPAINPPPAPRNVTPAALTVQPATRPGTLPAGRQGGPAPLPAPQGPRPVPKPVAVQPGMTRVGRAGMPTSVTRAGYGRGAATEPLPVAAKKTPLAPTGGFNLVNANAGTQNADVAGLALPPELGGQGVPYGPGRQAGPLTTSPAAAETPAGPLGKITQKGSSFSAPDDAGTVTLADARNAGKSGYGLSVIGMGLSPEATVQKLKDQTEQARQLNRMKETGLSEPELAKVDARRGKDSEIFQLSQSGISPDQAAGAIFQRDAALAKQTAESPSQSALNQQALLTGEQNLRKGEQGLEQGAAAAQILQAKREIAEKLGALDPADTKGRSALIDQLLAYDSKVQTPQKQSPLQQVKAFDEYGQPVASTGTFDPNSGQYSQPQAAGGAQAAQPTPAHIGLLQQNADNPDAVKEFEARYGPGSAAMYLAPKA